MTKESWTCVSMTVSFYDDRDRPPFINHCRCCKSSDLDKGRVVEQGSCQELSDQQGALWNTTRCSLK